MKKEFINPPNLFDYHKIYCSYATKVGNTLYIAGMVPRDKDGNIVGKGDIEAQTKKCFENMRTLLEYVGGSLKDVVKLNIYASIEKEGDALQEEYWKIRRVRKMYFPEDVPTTGCIVKSLAAKDLLVEIEAIAVLDT
jgi:enamine deaminase RidA (YjgF/YER057c/UK114 family)